MNRNRVTLAATLLCCAVGLPVAAADQALDDARDQILKSWRKYSTIRAKIRGESQFAGKSVSQKSAIVGEYVMMRKEDKVLVRVEFVNDEQYETDAAQTSDRSANIQVDDGEVLYTLVKRRGRDNVYKLNRAETKANVDLDRMFPNIAREGELKRLADAKVDDRPTFVIEQTMRVVGPRVAFAKNVFYFDKQRGLLLKTESFDEIGNPMRVLEYYDFKIDEPIDPNLFKFTPPPMAQIFDMTKPN